MTLFGAVCLHPPWLHDKTLQKLFGVSLRTHCAHTLIRHNVTLVTSQIAQTWPEISAKASSLSKNLFKKVGPL